jgi:hypothetical protein
MKPESRDALLIAIAKARGWIDDISLDRIGSFAEIAKREGQGERHIRLLAPLAFLSPRIIAAIVDGTAPASPRPCPILGSSRSRGSDCDLAPATNAGIVDRGGAFA